MAGSADRTLESLDELRDVLIQAKTGVVCIKPRVIFQLVERNLKGPQTINLPIPSSRIGSITTLEASIICSLLKLRSPGCIFEFGTFLGFTTSLFAMNTSDETIIYTIDLPRVEVETNDLENIDWDLIRSDDSYNDNYLTKLASVEGEYYLQNLKNSSKIKTIKMDSLNFDPKFLELEKRVDFIFIDGGHTDSIVEADTRNSENMQSQFGLILWHDFNSSVHRKVTDLVEGFANRHLVLHVENTLLAFSGNDYLKSIICD